MHAVVRNCNGEIKEPQADGLLKLGQQYRYYVRAAQYERMKGKFTYNNDQQELYVQMKKQT